MFEMRWVVVSRENRQLQYRFITPCVDASGGLCPGNGWGEWQDVPEIDSNEAAWEDLGKAGGLAPTYNDGPVGLGPS